MKNKWVLLFMGLVVLLSSKFAWADSIYMPDYFGPKGGPGTWLTYTYTKYDYDQPSVVPDFTVQVTRVDEGPYKGFIRVGDFYDWHPTGPEISWIVTELKDGEILLHVSSGSVIVPPLVIGDHDLECYVNCANPTYAPFGYIKKIDQLSVLAGTFNDVIVKFNSDPGYPPNGIHVQYNIPESELPYAVTHIQWYAKGIGVIKDADVLSDTGEIVHIYELASYDIKAFCPGDFDMDGDVDGSDLFIFAEDFGRTDCSGDCEGDFDTDGAVDDSDLAVIAVNFGRADCEDGDTFRGTAAAGAPIAGIVNIKGVNGATASSKIGVDGSYSIDVTDLTGPYILYAEGSVNGKSIKIYSAAVAPGTINITPVTDFIIRNAMAAPAETAYANWETVQVSESALSAVEADVQTLLSPALTAAGLGADVDLLTTAFTADHTGMDTVLDILQISYTGNTATVVNTLTGSIFTDDITLLGDSVGLPATDTSAIQAALTDAEMINAIWQDLAGMITARPYPSGQEWTDWVNAHVADDYLWAGENKLALLSDLILDDEPDSILTFTAVILEPLDVTGTGYTKGYWIRVFENGDEGPDSFVMGMVNDGVNWLLYGDQKWIGSDGPNPHAVGEDEGTFLTGFELGIDDEFNYAYDHGVRSAIVTGPGLPADGVLLAHQFPNTFIGVYPDGQDFYEINDDALIATIPDNAEYTYKLCSETADELNINGHHTCTILESFTMITMKPPLPKSALNASMFAALTNPSSHDLSDLSFGNLINVSWTNPAGTHSDGIDLYWESSGQGFYVGDDVYGNITTGILDTIGLPIPDTGWALVLLRVEDNYGRDFNRHWVFYDY